MTLHPSCFLFFPLALGLAAPAWASPLAVRLHPNGALVRGQSELSPESDQRTLRLPLPPGVDSQTLNLVIPGQNIVSLRFEDVAAPIPATVSSLRAQLDDVQQDIQELKNAKADIDARRAYWRKPPVNFSDVGALSEMDALMRGNLDSLNKEGRDYAARLRGLETQAALLKTRLEQAGDVKPLTREAIVRLEEPVTSPVRAQYSYTLPQAGWTPTYRLEAQPEKNTVHLLLEANLWQRGGEDWDQVPLTLTTADLRRGMTPPGLSSWIIRPYSSTPAKAHSAEPLMQADEASNFMMDAPPSAAPLYKDDSVAESWNMGLRSIPAGNRITLPLFTEDIPANFEYVLRPSRTEDAYLSAALDLAAAPRLPAGEALYLVDGSTVGKAPFTLSAGKNRLYFGNDPLVSATLKTNSEQSGKQGLIDRKQTYSWDWTITVYNGHQRPVRVRVEDPEPQSREEQIALQVSSQPPFVTEDHVLVWSLQVPAKESASIRHTVTLAAPTDMRFSTGR